MRNSSFQETGGFTNHQPTYRGLRPLNPGALPSDGHACPQCGFLLSLSNCFFSCLLVGPVSHMNPLPSCRESRVGSIKKKKNHSEHFEHKKWKAPHLSLGQFAGSFRSWCRTNLESERASPPGLANGQRKRKTLNVDKRGLSSRCKIRNKTFGRRRARGTA